MPRIPLIEDLTTKPVPLGSNLLVEFEPTSQWYNASITIAAGWLRTGGIVPYTVHTQPPENIRLQLKRLGLNTVELERKDTLRIWDYYSATLGQKSNERLSVDSLKVADLSIFYAKDSTGIRGPPIPDRLRMDDNLSVLGRFNEEKSWVEFVLTRVLPMASLRQSTLISGVMKGVHSEWAYSQLEGAFDGVIDFKFEENNVGETRDLIRIRNMRNVFFTKGWHSLRIGENFEVTLEK